MDLRTFYRGMGADYDMVCARLMSEERIRRYLKLTVEDAAFPLLRDSLEKRDMESAFRAAHSIKGICLNLELTALLTPVTALVENLRGGGSPETERLYHAVWEQYEAMREKIGLIE